MGAQTAIRFFRTFQEVRQRKSLYQKIKDYRANVALHLESEDFVVRTATAGHELLKVLELRHEVFIEEWQGRKTATGLDVDRYDFLADHLMIIDKRIDQVVGTYRLLSSHFTRDFYSSSEFNLTEFLDAPGVKLEMGRACVQASHRDGHTIDLLWKGLTQYVNKTGTQLMFGCTSIKSTEALTISGLYRTLHDEENWSDEHCIRPVKEFRFPGFPVAAAEPMSTQGKREHMPALLRSYLHAGAKVYGWPALDRDFACTDLLTILDWGRLHPRFKTRYTGRGSECVL